MAIRNIIYAMAAVLLTGLSACSVDVPETGALAEDKNTPQLTEDVVQGQLLVRFDARVSDILEKAGVTKSGPMMPMTRSGILSVDEILDLVEGYQIERVFPVDVRSEEKARKEGLHLWYVVRFSEEYPVEKVAADLSKLGEVSRVEYNRTLKKASDDKPTPLTLERLKELTANATGGAFDDPLLADQWHLVNNGNLRPTKFIKGADVNVENAWKEMTTGDPSLKRTTYQR